MPKLASKDKNFNTKNNKMDEDEDKKSESNQRFKYHKKMTASSKTAVMNEEFKHLNKTLTEIVDHLEDELDHVRMVNTEMQTQMNLTDKSISPTQSISMNHRQSSFRRPSQVKFAYETAMQKMQKMKQSQKSHHEIIRKLKEKIRKQAETISELPSEQEIKRLLEEIRKLLYELSEYVLFQDIEDSASRANHNSSQSKHSKYFTESDDDRYNSHKSRLKRIIETTESEYSHRRSPRKSQKKAPSSPHSSRIVTERHYTSYGPNNRYSHNDTSEDSEITDLKSVLKETKQTLEEIDYESPRRSPRRSPRKSPKRHRIVTERYDYDVNQHIDNESPQRTPKSPRRPQTSSEHHYYSTVTKRHRNKDSPKHSEPTSSEHTSEIHEKKYDIHLEDSYDDSVEAPEPICRKYYDHHTTNLHENDMNENEDTKRRPSSWRSKLDTLESKLESRVEEELIPKSVYDEEMKKLTEKNKDLQERVEQLEQDLNAQKVKYESEIVTKTEIIVTIKEELERTGAELDSMETEYEKLLLRYQHICDEFDKAIEEFNKGNDALLNRNKNLKAKLEQSLSRQIIEIKEKDQLLGKVQKLQKEKAKLRRHCMEYSKIYTEIEIEKEVTVQNHGKTTNITAKASEKSDNDNKEREVSKLRKKIDELTKEIENIHKKQAESQDSEILMRESKLKEIQELKRENEKLKNRLEEVIKSEEKNVKEIERLKQKLQELNKEIEETKTSKSNLDTKIKKLEQENASKDNEKVDLEHKIEEQKNDLDEKSKALAKATLKIDKLRTEIVSGQSKRKSTVLNQAFYKWQKDLTEQLNECSNDNDDSVKVYDDELQQIEKAEDLISDLLKKPTIKRRKKKKSKSKKNSKANGKKNAKKDPKTNDKKDTNSSK